MTSCTVISCKLSIVMTFACALFGCYSRFSKNAADRKLPVAVTRVCVRNEGLRSIDRVDIETGDFEWTFKYIDPGTDKTFAQAIDRLKPRIGPDATFKCYYIGETNPSLLKLSGGEIPRHIGIEGVVFCIQDDGSVIARQYK